MAAMRNTEENLTRDGDGQGAVMTYSLASSFPRRLLTQENVDGELETLRVF